MTKSSANIIKNTGPSPDSCNIERLVEANEEISESFNFVACVLSLINEIIWYVLIKSMVKQYHVTCYLHWASHPPWKCWAIAVGRKQYGQSYNLVSNNKVENGECSAQNCRKSSAAEYRTYRIPKNPKWQSSLDLILAPVRLAVRAANELPTADRFMR
jgi:hypothetical protein